MARWLQPDAGPAYAAAKLFVDRALASDDSLFTPGLPIWSMAVVDDLYDRFVGHPDESADRFDAKFQRQLEGAAPATYQLAAECLYVYFLMARTISGETKRALIGKPLSWSPQRVSIPSDLDRALDGGIAAVGIAFHTYRPFQLHYLLEFARAWKALDDDRRREALTDPWAFRQIAYDVPVHAGQAMREILLHLVHPDTFERITSRDVKQRIAEFYRANVTAPDQNVDRQLFEIRSRLAQDHGAGFDFWDEAVLDQWRPSPNSRWGQFVYWARRYFDEPTVMSDEREYKYVIAERLQAARDALFSDGDAWLELLRRAFGSPNNITHHVTHMKFLDWIEANQEPGRLALQAIWDDQRELPDRIRAFTALLPWSIVGGTGTRLNLASFLNMAMNLERDPPYQARAYDKAYELTGHAKPSPDADEADAYAHALAFLDTLDGEASGRGLAMRDRLDGQTVVWCITKRGPPSHWRLADRNAWLQYVGKPVEELLPDGVAGGTDNDRPMASSLDRLADDLLLDRAYLHRLDKLLRSKGQVIFYGPPGTGKTYVARKLAEFYANGDPSAVALVQFHPSYAYEDFVEGYRPAEVNGQPGFRLVPGPLRRFAATAGRNPSVPHVLIIDEINRGNVAKVFGELYFLLEYRTEDIALQYSPEDRFGLPANLYIIGTMNSADRSIALVDAALRRRFHFVPFYPDEPPIDGLLRRWLERHKPAMLWVADVVDTINGRLDDRQMAIGPSHFMRSDLDDEWVDLIWQHSILPYLAEQFVGMEDRLREFELSRLRGPVPDLTTAAAPTGEATAPNAPA